MTQPVTPSTTSVPANEFSPPGSLRIEDQPFAVVPEWVIDTEISDAAFRVYSLLLRFGNTSGQEASPVMVLTFEGAVTPVLVSYLERGVEAAESVDAEALVLQLDTPGGLDLAMREMIKDILASPVPVVTYVAPSGARAASAGTYILYASHVAAMAPATNLGAATPVTLGGLPGSQPEGDKSKDTGEESGKKGQASTLEKKMVNDAEAYIISLAERHGRNREWAAKAVTEAVSISAKEALPKTPTRILLKSWAMPPANTPRLRSF